MKTKKKKRSKKFRGNNSYGHGSRKKQKGSGYHGGCGMAGSGKRADHKITFITAKYGNTYFGKQGVTSRRTQKRKRKEMNLRELLEKFPGKKEVELKEYRILGDGEINTAVTIKAKSFTHSAKQKIEEAGGKVIILDKRIKNKIDKKEDEEDFEETEEESEEEEE